MNKNQAGQLNDLINQLSEMQECEQGKYDNAPENLQESERVEKFQENADTIQEAIDTLESILEY